MLNSAPENYSWYIIIEYAYLDQLVIRAAKLASSVDNEFYTCKLAGLLIV